MIDAEQRRWDNTIPQRKWAVVGRSIFNFFDQNADGVLDKWVLLVTACHHAPRPLHWWCPNRVDVAGVCVLGLAWCREDLVAAFQRCKITTDRQELEAVRF